MAVDDSWKEMVSILATESRHGERLVDTLARIIRERNVNARDAATVEAAKVEARDARFAFAAAILSTPEREIRVTRKARHAIDVRDQLISFEDMANDQIVYRVREFAVNTSPPEQIDR